MEKLTKIISKKSQIFATSKDIETVLSAAISFENVWHVVRHARVPIKIVLAVIDFLIAEKYIEKNKKKIIFTRKGKEFLQSFHITALSNFICSNCLGRGINVRFDKNLYKTFIEIYKNKPRPTFDFNQGSVSAESTIARVLYAISRKDVENKEILILGAEDDMIGLALALTKKPKKVVVLDIDQRLVDLDNEYARKLDLPLEAHVFDLRKPFPKKWLRKFDTFITEPSESIPAFKGFVLKGVAALRGPGSVGYFGYTLADSSLNKWYKIQKILLSHHLVISDILADFIRYEPFVAFEQSEAFKQSSIKSPQEEEWYFSHWYRVVALDGFFGANVDLTDMKKDFYLDKEIISD